jgi:DNA-binding NarL/FixJ family response regulator
MPAPDQNSEIRVAVVEDDDRLRASFIARLERAPGIRCVAAFANAEQALA